MIKVGKSKLLFKFDTTAPSLYVDQWITYVLLGFPFLYNTLYNNINILLHVHRIIIVSRHKDA